MQKTCKRLAAFLLAAALMLTTVPAAALADTKGDAGQAAAVTVFEEESTETGDADTGSNGSEEDGTTDSDTGESAQEETSYDFDIDVRTAKNSKNKITKLTVTVPEVTTTVTNASTGETVSEVTASYGLTVSVYVRGQGWVSAQKNDSGTAYTVKISGSGAYIQAVRIKPSAGLNKVMQEAGVSLYYQAKVKSFGTLGWATSNQKAGTTVTKCALKSFKIRFASKKPGSTQNHFVTKTSVKYKTRKKGASSWSSFKKNGATSGKASASTKLAGLSVSLKKTNASVSGGIQYRIRTTGSNGSLKWSNWTKGGKKVNAASNGIQTVNIKLTGKTADYYDVYYRVYLEQYGWLDWAKNGENAGAKFSYFAISAVQVELVPKGGSAPGSTKEAYIDSISGNAKLDSYLQKIYKKKGTNLKTLFNYVTTFTYYRTYETPTGSWSIQYAIEQWEHHGGNCYRFAALFSWLARGLGYDAKTVKGYVPSTSGGWAPHGWVEIRLGGTTYICDPDLAKFHPSRNWYFRTYSNPPTTYRKSS